MHQNISIRPAKIADVESLSVLSHQLGYPTDSKVMEKRLKEMIGKDDHCVFVATENKHILGWIHGFIALRVESDNFTEIGGMVVDEKNRNKGLGTLLVKAVENWSKEKNCFRMRVRSNTKRNDAHRFYQNLGFETLKHQTVFGKNIL